MKSGIFNFLEPSGPLQASNGTALPFYQGKWNASMVWMITARHLDREFHRQSVAESDPLLLIM